MTTIIGYHAGLGLSSEKRAVVQFEVVAASLACQMAADSADQYLQQKWENRHAMLALYFAWYDFARHSYPNGYEWLLDHHRQLWRDIQTVTDVRGML
jgi:hypothetical protein